MPRSSVQYLQVGNVHLEGEARTQCKKLQVQSDLLQTTPIKFGKLGACSMNKRLLLLPSVQRIPGRKLGYGYFS